MQPSHPAVFEHHERFVLHKRLGTGGFGIVYQAYDRHHHTEIALKVLYQTDPEALYRFKNEFRILSNLVHPNLVMLYELLAEGGHWFFTMELIDGVPLIDYLRGHLRGGASSAARASSETLVGTTAPDLSRNERTLTESTTLVSPGNVPPAPPPRRLPPLSLDLQRLRAIFLQLAEGVAALHAAHILHRDLKPSNVLVTPAGRVILLDFGLARDLSPWPGKHMVHPGGKISGTPAYMAPEQWIGQPETEASDWYSLGVMLYQALSGELPYPGTGKMQLAAKARYAPTPLSALVAGIPVDLESLCLDLLQSDGSLRPPGTEILRRLGQGDAPRARPSLVPSLGAEPPRLIGRARELAVLEEALAENVAGHPVLVRIHGASGVGKTALVVHFLERLEHERDAVLLTGRCYEQETVPYKAFDSLIDTLHHYLQSLPGAQAQALLPPDIKALARMFPVLESWVAPASDEPPPDPGGPGGQDPRQVRRQAFCTLKQILNRMASHAPLVLWIDDVQWADEDSARLLRELLSPPGIPPLLLLVSYRSEEGDEHPFIAAMHGRAVARMHDIALGPLPPDDACALALACLGGPRGIAQERAELITREAAGNPFLIEQLVQHVKTHGAPELLAPGHPLDEVLHARLGALPEGPRRLLETTAVAGRPLDQEVALAATDLGPQALSALTLLRSLHLMRTERLHDRPYFETYHDRIRTSVLSQLDAAVLAAHHRHLAQAFASRPDADPEVLAFHFHGAGALAEAARHAFAAAERASRTLAFQRAAELYGQALAWSAGGPDDTPALRRRLLELRADALALSGHGAEASPLYLAAASGAEPATAREMRRRAAEQYLLSGHIDSGLGILGTVLAEVGLAYPRSPGATLARIAALLLRLRLRGHAFRAHAERDIPLSARTRADVCWSASEGLADIDPLRATYFQLQHLRLALAMGEPARIAQGLAGLGGLWMLQGTRRAIEHGMTWVDAAAIIAGELDDPRLAGVIAICTSCRDLVLGRWRVMLDRIEGGIRLMKSHWRGVRHQYSIALLLDLLAYEGLGRLTIVAARSQAWQREASEYGDLFGRLTAVLFEGLVQIAAGELVGARERAREISTFWTGYAFHMQHLYAVRIEAYADLYEGHPAAAHERLVAIGPALRASRLLLNQIVRIDMLSLCARIAIAHAARTPGNKEWLALAERYARRLERELRCDARPLASLLRAGSARVRGHLDEALAHLDAAIAGFTAVESGLHAAYAKRCRGLLVGGDAGHTLVTEADTFMQQEGIRRPDQWTATWAPGFAV